MLRCFSPPQWTNLDLASATWTAFVDQRQESKYNPNIVSYDMLPWPNGKKNTLKSSVLPYNILKHNVRFF